LMGGEITVQSTLGRGSRFAFSIELPVATVDAVTTTVNVLQIDSLTVLVAEDNIVNQTVVGAMLRALGHRPVFVGTGRAALEALAGDEFDLVLMDCNMPELDGLEATRRLRAGACGTHDRRNIPVIALTANAMDGDRETCLAAGMNDFLAKPVTLADLRQAIDRVRGALAVESRELRALG
ncbi:MAG: response regulator, partial [Pseudomonadota bacterium]